MIILKENIYKKARVEIEVNKKRKNKKRVICAQAQMEHLKAWSKEVNDAQLSCGDGAKWPPTQEIIYCLFQDEGMKVTVSIAKDL